MTVNQFQRLDELDQLKMLIQFGILIGEIKETNARVFMYQVEDFYVETKYTLETDDLVSIDPFTRPERQEKSAWQVLALVNRNKAKYSD